MKLFAFAAALAIALGANSAFAGDVSKDSLAKMGLSGMTVASDSEGMQVRGQGYAFTSGTSVANILGNGAVNSYSSGTVKLGPAVAAGASVSVGGVALLTPIGSAALIGFGGGGAIAFAN
jgi:hypothetical protein